VAFEELAPRRGNRDQVFSGVREAQHGMDAACSSEELSVTLIDLLRGMDFGRRYFDFYEALPKRRDGSGHKAGRKELGAALAETGLDFRYFAGEKFFQHVEHHPRCDIMLHVRFRYSQAEFMLYVKAGSAIAGCPYPRLARLVVQATDPDFAPDPPSPKLPFSDEAGLREVVRFGVSLFEEARDTILAYAENRSRK
jgi:hypothetical protein